ncbi:MAG: hypothetical protein GQ570_01775 [Helicobacteraceae bacterium]|nr:hypothetical protein [Helicobacteraceae bacterium]
MRTILMSTRVTEADNYSEKRNSIAYEYIDFFEKLGFLIYLIPNNTNNIKSYFKTKIDLIVLSGGNNVNPNLYNNNELLKDVYDERDTLEIELLHISQKNNIPLLGICRGFHMINVFFKGLISHNIKNHVNKNHILQSQNNILNDKETNSFHNQGIMINDLSDKLEIIALSDDIVEMFIHKDKQILGIQWHPERQTNKFDKEIINKFLEGKL